MEEAEEERNPRGKPAVSVNLEPRDLSDSEALNTYTAELCGVWIQSEKIQLTL